MPGQRNEKQFDELPRALSSFHLRCMILRSVNKIIASASINRSSPFLPPLFSLFSLCHLFPQIRNWSLLVAKWSDQRFMKYPLLNICNRQGNRDFREASVHRRSSLAHVRICMCVCVYTCYIWRSRLRVRYFTFALRCLVARKLIAAHLSSRRYIPSNLKFRIFLGRDSGFLLHHLLSLCLVSEWKKRKLNFALNSDSIAKLHFCPRIFGRRSCNFHAAPASLERSFFSPYARV